MVKRVLMVCVLALAFTAKAFAAESVAPDYKVHAEDVLQITVYEQPDLKTTARVTSAGDINFPLLGKVMVAGLSVREIEEMLRELLAKDYLVNPQVQVFIEEYRVKQVSVLGAVNKPGKYDMFKERPTSVLEAIAMAEGFSKVADINGTRVIRQVDGVSKTIPVKVTDITQKGQKDSDIMLEPGDVVYIPESFF